MKEIFQYGGFLFEPVARYKKKSLNENMITSCYWQENKLSPFFIDGYKHSIFYQTYQDVLKPVKSTVTDTFNIYDQDKNLLVNEALPYTYGFAVYGKENLDKTLNNLSIKAEFNWTIDFQFSPASLSGAFTCPITLNDGMTPKLNYRLKQELYDSMKESIDGGIYSGKIELAVYPDCPLYFLLKGK
jgi:hypothetical protein